MVGISRSAGQSLGDPPRIRSIYTVGDPILQQIAEPVADVQDPQIQALIDDLLLTMTEANGVGISAPQVGVGLQILMVASRPNPRYPQAPEMDPLALINPQLMWQSEQQVWDWEGCLSVPDQRGLVARSQTIGVEYTNRQGQRETVEWQDFVARIFQHEWDHCLGRVFLERDPQRILTEAEYQRQIVQGG